MTLSGYILSGGLQASSTSLYYARVYGWRKDGGKEDGSLLLGSHKNQCNQNSGINWHDQIDRCRYLLHRLQQQVYMEHTRRLQTCLEEHGNERANEGWPESAKLSICMSSVCVCNFARLSGVHLSFSYFVSCLFLSARFLSKRNAALRTKRR